MDEQEYIPLKTKKRGRPFKKKVHELPPDESPSTSPSVQSKEEKLLDRLKSRLNILNKAKDDYNKALARLQRA